VEHGGRPDASRVEAVRSKAHQVEPGERIVTCASVPQCDLSERADGSGERGLGVSACLQRRGQLIGVGS
jgi:hypothetical protein